jgi:hypothetical protein
MDLVDIKAEASRLRSRAAVPAAAAAKIPAASREQQLQALKNKVERGAISPEEYEREKAKILQEVTGEKK